MHKKWMSSRLEKMLLCPTIMQIFRKWSSFSSGLCACQRVCVFINSCAWVRICAIGMQAGAVVEEGAAAAGPFACLVSIMTTAAHWPPLSSAARRRPTPASTEHTPEPPFLGLCCCLRLKHWLKLWVYFTPEIHYFQCICHSCWTGEGLLHLQELFHHCKLLLLWWSSNL